MVDIANIVNDSQLFLFSAIVPVFKAGNVFSKTIVIINAARKSNAVIITCFQKLFPLFMLWNHSFNEKAFVMQKYASSNK